MNNLKPLLEELISEVLGAFNLAKFKAIAATNKREWVGAEVPEDGYSMDTDSNVPEINYASKFLRKIGEGSSRITFILSGNKVLKIALNAAGHGQNKAEAEMWDQSRSPYITTVFDKAPDYKWIISEIVKELTENEAAKYLGVEIAMFDMIRGWRPLTIDDVMESLQSKIEETNSRIEEERKILATGKYLRQKQLDHLVKLSERYQAALNSSQFLNFVDAIINLVKKHSLLWDDVRLHHFGRNAEGQIKLLDYGFTTDVWEKFYE